MNAKELETQHNLKKWAAIIKECRSSGMKILQWLEINNISKDQYYYYAGASTSFLSVLISVMSVLPPESNLRVEPSSATMLTSTGFSL